jgi:hypothetical protein
MRTRQVSADVARAEALRARLANPMIIAVDGATSYWLEKASGQLIGPESQTSAVPLALVVALVDAGQPSDDLALVCRLADGSRYVIGGGVELLGAAMAAANRPRLVVARDRSHGS